jgi:hypothetical protein
LLAEIVACTVIFSIFIIYLSVARIADSSTALFMSQPKIVKSRLISSYSVFPLNAAKIAIACP